MFIWMLVSIVVLTTGLAVFVTRLFDRPVRTIYASITNDDFAAACARYVSFAAFVVGISSGIHSYRLDGYLRPNPVNGAILKLDANAWFLEIINAADWALRGFGWMYLWVFHLAVVGFILLRCFKRL